MKKIWDVVLVIAAAVGIFLLTIIGIILVLVLGTAPYWAVVLIAWLILHFLHL